MTVSNGKREKSGLLIGAAIVALLSPQACMAQSTLDMPLDTGRAGRAAAAAAPVSRSASALPSREMPNYSAGMRSAPSAAPQVLAQLGTVGVPTATIRIGQDGRSRALSVVARGVNLAVVADGGQYWGVLMANNTMGWVPKSSLQMIDYRTTIAVPSTPTSAPADVASPQADSQTGFAAQADVTANLDPRTTALLRQAFSYLGVPYVWAGTSRNGLDCSGFLCNVFSESLGVHLPRHSGDQAKVGQAVAGNDLRPGDRLYFDMGNRGEISHCGIYLGNGMFIHASTNHGQVAVDSVFSGNYRRALVCARRS